MNRRPRFLPSVAVAAFGLLAACDAPSHAGSNGGLADLGDPWTTEPDFQFGERIGGNPEANFAIVGAARVLGTGDRILVTEPQIFRATIWTPHGSLVGRIGGAGQAPGEFSGEFSVQVHPDGFYVRDSQRFTSYSNEGTLVGTIPFPPRSLGFRGFGLRPEALLDDGSVLASARVPPAVMIGALGDDPIHALPVFRLLEDGGQWRMDEIATQDVRNLNLSIIPAGRSMYHGGISSTQPLGDFDLLWFDGVVGSVVVVTRNLDGGEVEFVEVTANGDTAWRRRLAPPTVSLDSDQINRLIDNMARQLAASGPADAPPQELDAMRVAVQEALHIPTPLPGARRVLGNSPEEIWFRGFEGGDTSRVWYAVSRRDSDKPSVRRVLLPPDFRLTDVTDTHVWGVSEDDLGTQYIAGRRLIAPSGPVDEHLRATAGQQTPVWTSTPVHRIGHPGGIDAGFGSLSRLRVGGNGTRLVVWDAEIVGATPEWKILIYSAVGSLLLAFPSDDVRNGFGAPTGLRADADGFWTRHGGGSLKHSYDDGSLVDSVGHPPETARMTPLDDGGFLAWGDLPEWDWFGPNTPPQQLAVLRVAYADGHFDRDTLVVLDIRHRKWFVNMRGDSSQFGTQASIFQPFSDHDLTWFDSEAGSVGVVRRNGAAGAVRVFEVASSKDTVWDRRFFVPTVRLASEKAEAAIERNLSAVASVGTREGLSSTEMRSIVEDATYIPSHLPTVLALVVTASEEVWVKTPEVANGLSVWYSIPRGDDDAQPRRVLLPSAFRLQDAFGEHVWGISEEPSVPRRIVGLRLSAISGQ